MHTARSIRVRLFAAVAATAVLLSTLGFGAASPALAMAGPLRPAMRAMSADASNLYYYAEGKKVTLKPSLQWVSVQATGTDPTQRMGALAASAAAVDRSARVRHIPNPAVDLLPLQSGATLDSLAQSVNSMRAQAAGTAQANPVFVAGDTEMVVTDEFIARFPAGSTRAQIEAINASHSVKIASPVRGQPNTFVLQVTASSGSDALTMANTYQESGVATDAAPNFVRILPAPVSDTETRTSTFGALAAATPPVNDPLYPDQWYLNNTQQYGDWMTLDADIDVPGAWNQTTGSSSVVIAIIDNGVELSHEDLASKMVAGYDATGGGTAGAPCTAPCAKNDDAHGTEVAGLAAAVGDNAKGIAGVCQGCSIMPVRVAYGNGSGAWITTDAWEADGITWAYQHGAAILNNSWGGGSSATVVNTAINNAKSLGRSGKGAVVIFAAGDGSTDVRYPARLDNVIAVGASNMCDALKTASYDLCNGNEPTWGSNSGDTLDLVAPGVWLDTTDRNGTAGDSPTVDNAMLGSNNYFAYMNGTSGAAAIVSGVAGLILSANSGLSASQVQTILQDNADDVNAASLPGWDSTMGYGRVNANRAVGAAADLLSTVLTIAKDGNGAGTVTSSPDGIDCGSTCNYAFNKNTVVTLTAVPLTRSVFTGWSGAGCSGTGACIVTMSVARTVTARFDLPIPAKPTLSSPAAAAMINDNTPLLAWNAALYGNTYRVQIAKSSTFGSPVQDHTGAAGVLTYTATALSDGQYFWRVRSYGATSLIGPWTNGRSFTVDTTPPGVPVPTLPINNAVVHTTTTQFKWKAVAGANAYQFVYDDDPGFGSNNYVSSVISTTYITPPAMPLGTWYWRVAARDAAGNWGVWCTGFAVNVHAPLPARPVVTSPATGFVTTDTTPTFTWNPAANASTYEVRIDNSSGLGSPEYVYTGIVVTTFEVPVALPLGRWYWQVRAVNVSGDPGLWSGARNILIH